MFSFSWEAPTWQIILILTSEKVNTICKINAYLLNLCMFLFTCYPCMACGLTNTRSRCKLCTNSTESTYCNFHSSPPGSRLNPIIWDEIRLGWAECPLLWLGSRLRGYCSDETEAGAGQTLDTEGGEDGAASAIAQNIIALDTGRGERRDETSDNVVSALYT